MVTVKLQIPDGDELKDVLRKHFLEVAKQMIQDGDLIPPQLTKTLERELDRLWHKSYYRESQIEAMVRPLVMNKVAEMVKGIDLHAMIEQSIDAQVDRQLKKYTNIENTYLERMKTALDKS